MSTFGRIMSRAPLKLSDTVELSRLFEAEFNKPDLHDRVLIFDVVASPPRRLVEGNENERNEASDRDHDDDGNAVGTAKNANDEKDDNQIENKLGNENEGIGTATNENRTEFTDMWVETKQADEREVKNDHKTPLEIGKSTCNESKLKGDCEPEIPSDDDDENRRLNDEEKTENRGEISNETGEVIQQHKFYIHSSWLAVQSSYFRSLFFPGAKEPNATEIHVRISASEEEAHLMLLEAMYKIDTLDNASIDELLDVLRLAHKYDVKFVFRKCKYRLQTLMSSIEVLEKIMRYIKVDNSITYVEDFEKKAQSFLVKEFIPLDQHWETKRFEELSQDMLKLLLSSDDLVVASENTVFHALIHWIKQRGIDKVVESQGLPSLLSVVRFELMPIDYLYCNVQHNPVAKKLPDFKEHYLRGISYHALSDRLPRPPTRRNAGTFVPYTWTITANKLDEVVRLGKSLESDKFWYCGYRMVLMISHVHKVKDLVGNKALFTVMLSLAVTNLTEQSEVSIRWKVSSRSFTSSPAVTASTLTRKACTTSASPVAIKYEMEVTQEQSNSNVTESATKSESTSSAFPCKFSDGVTFNCSTSITHTQPGARTATIPVSTSSVGVNFSVPHSNVTTSARTTTVPGFTSSTLPSTSSVRPNFSVPQSNVATGARTTTVPGFTSSTLPSTSSVRPNFSVPQSNVATGARTTTVPGFTFSTLPSTTGVGPSFSFPQSNVATGARTTTVPRFTFSTLPSTTSVGPNFSVPQSNETTSDRTTAVSGFTFSTPPSTSSVGLNFSFPQSNVTTSASATTTTVSGFTSSTPSTLSGGFNVGTLHTTTSEASANSTKVIFGNLPRRYIKYNQSKSVSQQESPTPKCLSIEVKIRLV